MLTGMLASVAAIGLLSIPSGVAGALTPQAPPSGNSGTTVSPLQYNCANDSPTCGPTSTSPGIGESYGYYNGQDVRLLYTENYYCGTSAGPTPGSTSGCEAGYASTTSPPANTTHADTLYIPVPLFANPPPTQCSAAATCIDHPATIDLSALASADSALAGATNVGLPNHDHVVGTRNNGNPEWWSVEVVATTSPTVFNTLTSVSAINAAKSAGTVVEAPTNVFLFFQVLPGTVPAAQYDAAMAAGFPATSPPASATTFDNLKQACSAGGPYCSNVGVTSDWYNGKDVNALYTENFYCDTSVSSGAPSGCEAGVTANTNPPGVTGPVPTVSSPDVNTNMDPLYIPVPIGFTPTYLQCPSTSPCIDHPTSIDLSRLSSVLDPVLHTTPAELADTMLPGHDHLLANLNSGNPEWWNVIVIPVTTQAALNQVQTLKSYSAVKAMETSNFSSGVGPEIPTNAYLWFQVLPGTSSPKPGPVKTDCMASLPAGSVVGMAATPGDNGYVEVDAAGDVATKGGATCYGSMTGIHLNQPIVGVATDPTTGGYWLVASDGGVFAFNAPFYGSAGSLALNKPVVGIASTRNGNGYRLVASDGGVFDYGSAAFYGSTGSITLNKPVVGMAVDPTTGGYWLVASDGGVFAFNAPFDGSMGGTTLNKPVVGIAPTLQGNGYRLFASDGGIFDFGSAGFFGSTGGIPLDKPVVGGVSDTAQGGYWMVASDGGIFSFNAPFYGSAV